MSRNCANIKYYITKRLSVNCIRERAVTSSVSVNSLSSLPQQRCIYIHGDSVCIYASDGVGLYMGPRAAQEDLGRVELGQSQGVGTVC